MWPRNHISKGSNPESYFQIVLYQRTDGDAITE